MALAPDVSEIRRPGLFPRYGLFLVGERGLQTEIIGPEQLLWKAGAKVSFDPNVHIELLGPRLWRSFCRFLSIAPFFSQASDEFFDAFGAANN